MDAYNENLRKTRERYVDSLINEMSDTANPEAHKIAKEDYIDALCKRLLKKRHPRAGHSL